MNLIYKIAALGLISFVAVGCDNEQSEREVAALSGMIDRLTAFQAAAATVPTDATGFALPDGVVLRVFCGDAAECADANTKTVSGETLGRYQELREHARAGSGDFNLQWFREHTLAALPRLRFFAIKLPDGTTGETAWNGRVAVWDSQSRAWLGAVRVDLDRGRVPENAYALFDGRGTQLGGSFSDGEEDSSRANSAFQGLLPHAFRAAVESGRDVTRIGQVSRQRPRPLGVDLAADAVIFSGGDRGALVALSNGAFVDLGTDEVTNLWSTGDGFVYQRARNVVGEGAPWLLQVKDGRVEDMTFYSATGAAASGSDVSLIQLMSVREEVWVRAQGSTGPAELAKWVDADWEPIDLANVTPSVRRVVAVDEADGTRVVLTTGGDGPGLHVWRGSESTSVSLPRNAVHGVELESASSALVSSNEGLFRVDLDSREVDQLTRQSVRRLVSSPHGAWIAQQRRRYGPVDLARVDGSSVRSVREMRADPLDELAVGSDGTVAVLSRGVVIRRAPDGTVQRIPEEGSIPGNRLMMEMQIDGHGTIWIATQTGVFVVTDEGLHTLATPPVPAVQSEVRDVCILGSGPVLTAADLRPVR